MSTRAFTPWQIMVQLGFSFVMVGLGLAGLFWGPFSDRLGRKPVLFISLVMFIVFSGVSVVSPSIGFFLGCRLFQGLGALGAVMLSKAILKRGVKIRPRAA